MIRYLLKTNRIIKENLYIKMKIQGNTDVIWNTEKTPESDKNMNVSGNEAVTKNGYSQRE